MKSQERETLKSLDERRMTEWLKPEQMCGATGFANCHTNRGWIMSEVRRLRGKNVNAVVVSHNGEMAIFRPMVGESAYEIERKLDEAEKQESERR